MIKFFRRIRQNMIKENRVSKYLLYAIGEIVLVVVGILIALSINNWNIEEQERNEEIETLKNLRLDFKNTIKELNELKYIRNTAMTNIRIIFSIIETKKNPYSEKELDTILMRAIIPPTYNSQSGTLDMLFNSGKINIISNNKIKNLLISWPGLVSDMTEEELMLHHLQYEQHFTILFQHLSFGNVIKTFKYRNIPFHTFPKGSFVSDYGAFFRDNRKENIMAIKMMLLMLIESGSDLLTNAAKEIINEIDIELKTEN